MGSGFKVLYDSNDAANKDKKKNFQPPSRASKPRPKKTTKKVEEDSESADEEDETEEEEESKPKAAESSLENGSFTQRIQNRELISEWLLRIFKEDTLDQIKRDIAKKGDQNLAWTFMQNLDLLKKAQLDCFSGKILGKRKHEDQEGEEQYDEEKFKKFLKKEVETNPKKKTFITESEEEKFNKLLITKKIEDYNTPKNPTKYPTKKVFQKTKKKQEEVKPNSEEHQILADSISFYKSAAHFKKTIASLPLFKRELEAFKETLRPKEIKIIEDAIETGFNPVHYIYKYRIGEKTLASIKGGIYKKCLNTPSIQLIYRYIEEHLQKKKFEEDTTDEEDTYEPSSSSKDNNNDDNAYDTS